MVLSPKWPVPQAEAEVGASAVVARAARAARATREVRVVMVVSCQFGRGGFGSLLTPENHKGFDAFFSAGRGWPPQRGGAGGFFWGEMGRRAGGVGGGGR